MALTLHKAMTKRIIRDLGIATPDFAVVERAEDVDGVHLPFPLFAKPVAEGTSKGITADSRIESQPALRSACERLLATFRQPVLVETYLPGREVTVGLVGTGPRARAIGTMEVRIDDRAEANIYTQNLKEDWHGRLRYTLPEPSLCEEAQAIALRVWRGLGCRDAGRVDLRQGPDGRLQFIEVNPLAGLHPEHSDLPILCTLKGIPYQQLIEWVVESAMERVRG
jgi:D-alanine-D-alanine ligase